jgi:hypothetical protein
MRLSLVSVLAALPLVASANDGFMTLARQLRLAALARVSGPPLLAPVKSPSSSLFGLLYPWHQNITTTTFWVGEPSSPGSPSNARSAWDLNWLTSYGGCDSPLQRKDYLPAAFVPRQNPFYVALPYNDVENGHTKPEAAAVIPWFRSAFVRDGQSVCKGQWVAIRRAGRVCFAQWEDVGPFRTDLAGYVFGAGRPAPNRNQDAGLDVSPAVREYLGLSGTDLSDWKFVSQGQVPPGPWASFGEASTLALR